MDSAGIAASVALVAFGALLLCGFVLGELTAMRVALFLLVWLAGRIALAYVAYEPARGMGSSFTAALDIVLVFIIFKGDVRLT